MMRETFFIKYLGLVLFIVGMVLLWQVDWKVPVGVFLVTWAHSLGQLAKQKESNKKIYSSFSKGGEK